MKNIFQYRLFFNPFIRYKLNNLGIYSGTNEIKREVPLVVSITSDLENIDNLCITIYSLMKQSIKPDKIILWLSNKFESNINLPYEITQFVKNGLEIKFVEDIGIYNRTIYPIKESSDSAIVVVSEGFYYDKKWLEKLYYSYVANPKDLHVHIADEICYDNNAILSYKAWHKNIDNENAKYNNFGNIDGGILIPPGTLSKEFFREDIFLKYAPFNDSVWIWLISVISSRKIRVVKNHIKFLTCLSISKIIQKYADKSSERTIDKQITRLMRFYGQNIFTKLT